MKFPIATFRKLASLPLLIVAATLGNGCHHTPNASKDQILPDKQPEPIVNTQLVTCKRNGDNLFLISLNQKPKIEIQENPKWCWAVCVAGVMNYNSNSSRTTQEDFVRAVVSHRSDQTANEMDVLTAIDPTDAKKFLAAKEKYEDGPHKSGFMVVNPVGGNYYDADVPDEPNASCLIDELAQGRPVIVGIDPARNELGHVVLVISAECSLASTDVKFGTKNPYYVHDITVLDPEDGQERTYSAHEDQNVIDRIGFATSKELAISYLSTATNAYVHAPRKHQNG